MERLEGIAQTYSQAPWRKQLQMIVLFSLALVVIALVAGIYLSVSARTAKVGRDIQSKQKRISELDLEIENLQSQYAGMMSSAEMEDRARSLGYQPVQSDQMVYLNVPGYVEQQPAILAPYSSRPVPNAPVTPSEYTESLLLWLKKKTVVLFLPAVELKP